MTSKRKRQKSRERENEVAPEDEIVVEDMDLYVNIEDIEFPDEEQTVQDRREATTKLATQEPMVFEEESLNFHSSLFEKGSNKLVIEKGHVENKTV